MLFWIFMVDKSAIVKPFLDSLDDDLKEKYYKIGNERKAIYLKGYSIGFIISLAVIYLKFLNKISFDSISVVCLTGAITFFTSYFYYILSPKSDHMIKYLNNRNQRELWLDVYKKMQLNYHVGVGLGLICVMYLSYSAC
jgi:hypothetical protein